MKRNEKDTLQTREKLLSAALKVFTAKGFAATRLQDIANEAGMTRGAVYWHFKNKIEIFTEVYINSFTVGMEDIEAIIKSKKGTLIEKIREIISTFITKSIDDPDYKAHNILHYSIEWSRDVYSSIYSSFEHMIEKKERELVDYIKECKLHEEELRRIDPEIIAKLLRVVLCGLANIISSHPGFILKKDIDPFIDLLIHGMVKHS